MKNLLNIKTPAQDQAHALKADYGLSNHGISNLNQSYWNLPTESLYEEVVFRNEGKISRWGPLVVNSGKHTARAAHSQRIGCMYRLPRTSAERQTVLASFSRTGHEPRIG